MNRKAPWLAAIAIASFWALGLDGCSFTHFGRPSTARSSVVLQAFGPWGYSGVFVESDDVLRTVADTATPLPGAGGRFTGFGVLTAAGTKGGIPGVDGADVAFWAIGEPVAQGIYARIGERLVVIADTTTPVPAEPGTFSSFGLAPAIHDGDVAFLGHGPLGENVYLSRRGRLHRIADTATAIPGGTGTFELFGNPAFDGVRVAFQACGAGNHQGVYVHDGVALEVVADVSTLVPGTTGVFEGFSAPSMDASSIVFRGWAASGQDGIYAAEATGLQVVADRSTVIPGRSDAFTAFAGHSIDGGAVAFHAFGAGGYAAILVDNGGTLSMIADSTTTIPGGFDAFVAFDGPSLSDGRVAFRGFGPGGQEGVYVTTPEGGLRAVADTTTPVP